MGLTFISTIVLLIAKYIFCGFSFWILIDTVVVALFCLRMAGATFKIKVLCIMHGVSFGLWLLWTFIFGGWEAWPKMLIYLGIGIATCAVMLYEDIMYVIVEKDERVYDNGDSDS